MSETKVKPMITEIVKFEVFSAWDFIPPGSFYIRTASGDYLFLKTSDRMLAQKHIDTDYGKGKYTVIPTKVIKTKSKLESGGLSCTGTATRRGQQKR
jgi:hypothetical protein